MHKKLMSVVLSLCMAFSCATVAATVTNAATVETAEVAAADYGLADNVQDGQILQCWNWSYNGIKNNMQKIAEQGFTAIQTSPIQTTKESTQGKTMAGSWWVYYQPSNFTIETSSQNALGTKTEFEAMCDEAHKYGVKVIVDAVLNHMANTSGNDLSSTIPSDIRNDSSCWHDISKDSWYASRYDITQYCMDGLPDLNTSNTKVQNYAISFLKECIDAGADGFRFDGAKHIETPVDSGCASNFWPNVLNATTSYAESSRGFTPYYYGEVLDKTTGDNDGGNGSAVVGSYTSYMSITMSSVSNSIRNSVNSGDANGAKRSDYNLDDGSSVAGTKAVLWNESHDTYASGSSSGQSDTTMKKTWAMVGSRANASAMYFARPTSTSTTLGTASVTAWGDAEVKAVNQFKNYFAGQSEYLSTSGSIAYNERGTSGVVLVNLGGSSASVSVTANKMAAGTYTDQITGNTFTVANGKISGNIGSTGIAVVYNAVPAGPSASVSPESKSYKTDTLTLTLSYKNATSGQYSIDGGSYQSFTDGQTITIGQGVDYGTTTTVSVKASDGSTTSDVETYTYTKVDPSLTQKIYFDNSSYNWSSIYAYIYVDSTTNNGAWPGQAMTYDSSTGYYVVEVPEGLENGLVIFTESSTATTNRYPADMEDGLSLGGSTKLFTSGNKFIDYVVPTTPTSSTSTTATTPTSTTAPVSSVLIGDINQDGSISISDATDLQLYLAKMKAITGDALIAADCDADGTVDIKDVTCIQYYCVKLTAQAGKVGTYTGAEPSTSPTSTTATTPTSTTATQPTTQPAGNYVYYKNTNNWSKVNAYYWSDANTTMTTWPGVAMTSLGNNEYRIEVPADATYIIFNDGASQTDDLTLQIGKIYNNGTWSTYTGGGSDTTQPTTQPSGSGTTVTFTDSLSWGGTIYCYYWATGSAGPVAWPGTAMTSAGTNDYGQATYTFAVPAGYDNIIFTNGSSQTVDITLDGSATRFYAESSMSGSGYNVGTW